MELRKTGMGGGLLPDTWALMLTRPKTGGAGKARSPGHHFRDYGPAQNKLLKPGQGTRRSTDCGTSISGVVTRSPTWATTGKGVTPQSVVLSTLALNKLGALGGGVMEKKNLHCWGSISQPLVL